MPVPKCADDRVVEGVVTLDENVDEGLCGFAGLSSHPSKQRGSRGVTHVKRF